MRLTLRSLYLTMCGLIFMSVTAFSQTATISTDQADYPPGSTVIISGSGFQAGEPVTLQVLHYPTEGDDAISPDHQPWTVSADANGNVSSSWYIPDDQDELGATLQLTAVGQNSGLQAQVTFTDADPITLAGAFCNGSNTTNFTASVPSNGNNIKCIRLEFPAGLTVASVTVGNLPSGWVGTTGSNVINISGATNLNTSTTYNFSVTFTTIPSAGYSVSLKSGSSCPNNTNGGNTITTVMNPLPVVSTPSSSLCIGSSMNLTPNSGGTWTSSDISKATVTNGGVVTGVATGNVTFTFTSATTGCSNTTSTVTINSAPTISATNLPASGNINNAPGTCAANVSFGVGTNVTLTGTPTPTITYKIGATTITSPNSFPVGTTTVTATTSNNGCGSASTSFTVTVTDNEKPVITTNGDKNVNNDLGVCGAAVTVSASATDNCSVGTPTGVRSDAQPLNAVYPVGTTTITWNVTDIHGNAALPKMQTVIVTDNENPVLTAGANRDVNLNGSCSVTIPDVRGTATDNCAGTVITQIPSIGAVVSSSHNATINVTVTATDAGGNTDVKTVVLTAKDVTPPTIVCPANITLSACTSTATWTAPSGSDNCSGLVVTQSDGPASGSTFAPGSTTTISYLATDAAGNTATCSFTVTRAAAITDVVTNDNPILYYGYTLDQSSNITVKPQGGVGPYKVTFTMSRPLNCNMVNSSGDEVWTPGANTSSSSFISCPSFGLPAGNASSTSTNNINSVTGYSVNVTLMQNATIYILITDANNCTYLDSAKVIAEDVRCFAGNSNIAKVTLCHQTGSSKNPCVTICVDASAVPEHIAHGDFYGKCTSTCQPAHPLSAEVGAVTMESLKDTVIAELSFGAKAYPNPSSSFFNLKLSSASNEPINISVVDAVGRVVERRTEYQPNSTIQIGQNYHSGIYFVEVMQGSNRIILRLSKQN